VPGANPVEALLRRIPLVGRFAHVGYLIISFGLFQVLGLGVQRLVLFPLAKHYLGPRVFGSFLLAFSFATLAMMIAAAGPSGVMFRLHSLRTPERKPFLYVTGLWVTVFTAAILGAGLLAATPILYQAYNADVAVFSGILVCFVVAGAAVSYLAMVLRAQLHILLSASLQNMFPLLSAVMFLAIWLCGDVGVSVGMGVGMAWTLAIIVWVLSRLRIISRWTLVSWDEARSFLKTGPLFALSGLAATANIMAGRWFVGYYCQPEDVTYYYVASAFGLFVTMPLSHVSMVIFPLICARRKLTDFSRKTLQYYYMVCLILVPVVFLGGWVVARPMMILYGKDSLARSQDLLFYIMVGISLDVFTIFARNFILKFCSEWTIFGMQAIPLVVNVGLNIVLLPRYGVLGAAWALGVSTGVRGLMTLVITTHLFFRPPRPREAGDSGVCDPDPLPNVEPPRQG